MLYLWAKSFEDRWASASEGAIDPEQCQDQATLGSLSTGGPGASAATPSMPTVSSVAASVTLTGVLLCRRRSRGRGA